MKRKFIHISDSSLVLSFPILIDSPESIVKEIKSKYADADLFLININYKTDNITRADNAGILFLKYLRLNHFNQHCVLYSFLNREQLMMQDPHNSIIFSEGVTFVRMPEDLSAMNFEALANKRAPDNLSKYFIGEVNLEKIRHNLANIYGLWFMFNIHNKFFPEEKLERSIFPNEFSQKLDFLQLVIAKYLINIKKENNSGSYIISQIKRLKTELRKRNPQLLYIDDKADLGWAAFLKKAIYGNSGFNNFQSIAPEKTVFNNEKSLNDFFVKIKNKILNNGNFIDCLLLDLRLADETGDIDDLDKLSGIRLLKRIHQSFPSLPVVIFTASNKAKSVKKIIECGAEVLWSKPGLDDLKEEQYYLESYRELLTYLNTVLNKYKTRTEKFIVNAQFQVESIPKSGGYPKVLENVNTILTDTCFWCDTSKQLIDNHKSVRRLLDLNADKHIQFIVIDDVLKELFIHTQNKEINLKKSAQYALESIQNYKDKGLIVSGFKDVEISIKKITTYSIEEANSKKFLIVSNVKKVHTFHTDKEEAIKELKKRKIKNRKPLHADDTFLMLIPYYLEKNVNLLFISDDAKNTQNIIRTIGYKFGIDQSIKIPKKYDKEKQLLKVKVNNNFCYIAHSKVLYEICFPGSQDISLINIPSA